MFSDLTATELYTLNYKLRLAANRSAKWNLCTYPEIDVHRNGTVLDLHDLLVDVKLAQSELANR